MRNNLPKNVLQNECAVINLDNADGPGTHWVTYCKNNSSVYYFDSFGNLEPPKELVKYLGSNSKIYYNYRKYQDFGTIICGHLCIQFLYDFYKENNYKLYF